MSSKRTHEESEGVHSSRKAQVYDNANNPAKKPRPSKPPIMRRQAHASSVNAVKKRIRDVTRKLQRVEDLPADVKMESERALAAYQTELAAAAEEKTRQKMIKKYHMVRFFERQKATRTLKRLKKQLLEATTSEENEAIQAQMHIAEVDINYTQFYPLNEKYLSLYPQKGKDDEEKADAEEQPKPPLWIEIEKRMEEGTLKELRYGVREGYVEKPKVYQPNQLAMRPKAASKQDPSRQHNEKKDWNKRSEPELQPDYTLNRRERRKALKATGSTKPAMKQSAPQQESREEEDYDGNISDGGFFEE